ncbi:long-chain specific acyl-CoA dehydrogenase, mitochondrial isoform X3 [Xiphophorus maculatus]|uniref:long-chain specific acyl-CoA dehydrogenase, mitochondrial isoform X3 n=1 Tax=Xiphophorus maculatus TaxID=8083 RepID=UPI000C6D9F56|nr:long-chain specific acyl-CoA dehydrogenase, mitochondrial isoform X3 [Xiphophorus maculatus]
MDRAEEKKKKRRRKLKSASIGKVSLCVTKCLHRHRSDVRTGLPDVESEKKSLSFFQRKVPTYKKRAGFAGVHKSRGKLRKYSCSLTFDSNTVHRNLELSDNGRKVTWVSTAQSYPDHPDRFDGWWPQLLCSDGLTGRCYWEVEWSGVVYISVSYRGISRGGYSMFGWNDQSWSLKCCDLDDGYSVWHKNKGKLAASSHIDPSSSDSASSDYESSDPASSDSASSDSASSDSASSDYESSASTSSDSSFADSASSGSCNRVAVYVDCPAGILSFYRISSGSLVHLHTFRTTFSEPIYPGFGFWCPGSSVSFCQDLKPKLLARQMGSPCTSSQPDWSDDHSKLVKAPSSFRPQVETHNLHVSYRFRCPGPGVFECSLTGLVFVVTQPAKLCYRIIQWDESILQPAGKTPAGPLYSISCSPNSVCGLHLPHCQDTDKHSQDDVQSSVTVQSQDGSSQPKNGPVKSLKVEIHCFNPKQSPNLHVDLLNILDELNVEEFSRFKWFLRNGPQSRGFRVRESAEREEVVDRLLHRYSPEEVLQAVKTTLKSIGRNDLVERL